MIGSNSCTYFNGLVLYNMAIQFDGHVARTACIRVEEPG